MGVQRGRGCPTPPEIDNAKLEKIRKSIAEIMYKWAVLAPGEHLELIFGETRLAAT